MKTDKKTSILGKMFNKLIEFITAAFLPSISVLAAAGILKGIIMLLSVMGILAKTSNTFLVLNNISSAMFYFLPIFLAMNIAKYFNANVYLNALIAMSLVVPDMITLIGKKDGLTFLGLKVMNISYGNMLFPVLLAIILSCYLEKGIDKIMPELLRGFITPALVMAIMVPAILLVFGPIGQAIGNGLTVGFTALYHFSPILCGAVIAPAYMLLCIFGLHWFIVPIMLNNIALTGFDPVMGMCSLPAWICIGVSLAMMVRSKTADSKSKSISAAFSAVFGIIEPTLFPILIALKKPLVMATVINVFAGAAIGIFGSSASAFAPPGPSATTLFIGKGALPLLIVGAVSMAAGFIGMVFLGYSEIPVEKGKEITA